MDKYVALLSLSRQHLRWCRLKFCCCIVLKTLLHDVMAAKFSSRRSQWATCDRHVECGLRGGPRQKGAHDTVGVPSVARSREGVFIWPAPAPAAQSPLARQCEAGRSCAPVGSARSVTSELLVELPGGSVASPQQWCMDKFVAPRDCALSLEWKREQLPREHHARYVK